MARVLVIEDDQEIASLVERYLKRQGFIVVTAFDGEAGIKAFSNAEFDVVLTDGLLPKKTGYEVVSAIRAHERGKSVGILMMSAAFRGPQAKREAATIGADAFFAKPFVLTELRESIHELMKKYGRALPPKPAAPAPAPKAVESQAPKPASPLASPGAAPAAPPPKVAPVAPPAATPPASKPAGSTMPAAPKPAAPVAREPAKVGALEHVRAPEDVARLLLRCARQGFTGVLRFVDEQNQLVVAFIHGVIVGANDNLREHLLGERLWKAGRLNTDQMRQLNLRMAARNERVAEALLALGFCTAGEALQYVEEQSLVRARRSLAWSGAVQLKENEDDAQALANTTLDVVEVILGWAFDKPQEATANRFIAARAVHRIAKHPRFDDLLIEFARVAPAAKLPALLLADRVPTVVDAARQASASEIYGAWLAGLVVAEGDPDADVRPLPDVLRVVKSGGAVDKDAVESVCTMLLRARGRTYYELLDEPRTTASDVMRARVSSLLELIGPSAIEGRALGPAVSAARELWHILDEAEAVFADEELRAIYDGALRPLTATPNRATGPEDAFLEGQAALAEGAAERARECFSVAVTAKPHDPDYVSYLGWSQVLCGDRDNGIARLTGALRAHPQAMRPVFFLGLTAAKDGDAPRARALLEECARRSPDDVEVTVALSSLG